MSLEYTNRFGDRYYVLQGRTKTGKPKYYCSRKADSARVERLPEGYEIHESPRNAVVTIRKVRQSRILPAERQLVERLAGELSAVPVIVDVDGDKLVIYASEESPASAARRLERVFGDDAATKARIDKWVTTHANYAPALCFKLVDENHRLYRTDRWCYRSSVDGWLPLDARRPLEPLARAHLPHLGRESFFDLI